MQIQIAAGISLSLSLSLSFAIMSLNCLSWRPRRRWRDTEERRASFDRVRPNSETRYTVDPESVGVSFYCFTSTEARRPWTAARTTDSSYRMSLSKAVPRSVRHCAATTAPRSCCPNCYAERQSQVKTMSAVGKQLKQKKSNSLYPSTTCKSSFFWASFFVRVQLTSLALDLAWTLAAAAVDFV